MSLKAFHIIFVVFSTLTALGFGFWAIRHYRVSGEQAALIAGIGSFMGGAVLIVYGRWFLRKLKGVSYL